MGGGGSGEEGLWRKWGEGWRRRQFGSGNRGKVIKSFQMERPEQHPASSWRLRTDHVGTRRSMGPSENSQRGAHILAPLTLDILEPA